MMESASQDLGGSERREHTRYSAQFVVNIESGARKGRFGVVRNASAGGLLFNTPSAFRPGEDVVLTILFPTKPALRIAASVVRVEDADTALPWRFMTAAKFEMPLPELDQVLSGLVWD